MRTPFDWFAKHLVASALRDAATVQTEREVSSEVQAIDAWVRPNPRGESARKRAGFLGRMAERTCLIEAFHKPPSSILMRTCLQKLLALDAELRREAKRVQEKPAPLPRLWIVTAGDPARARQQFGLRPARDWPVGVYRAPPGFGLAMVVASESGATRDKLIT